jgi:hypothetical protein
MGILISGYTRETGMLKIPKVKELAEILQNSEILDSFKKIRRFAIEFLISKASEDDLELIML